MMHSYNLRQRKELYRGVQKAIKMNLTLDKFFPIFDERKDVTSNRLYNEFKRYHEHLLREVERCYKIAEKARSLGLDPKPYVEIPIAKNMAERVEKLLNIDGIAKKILEYENEGLSRIEICFRIAEDIVKGEFGNFDREDAIDKAVRAAVAIQTEGVVAAPIEGIAKVKIFNNEFIKIYYAGPIRSAGGTAQVISVIIADYVRRLLGIKRYVPTKEEVMRYCEEIPLYKKVANLQYLPSEREIVTIVENCPICIDGEPTEDAEVSGYRNLPRVETNRVRGGMCLVIAEGIALKAPKLKKIVEKMKIDGWDWLDKLIHKEEKEEEEDVFKPKDKYLADLIAGRPVFSHPSRKGGFRLRYGRARNSGFATVALNPATMLIAGEFIAIGTQLKVELPGKAGSVVPVTEIEGPTVRLKNGDVVRVNSFEEAMRIKDSVEKILDMGEILINFGDFLENNHPLLPASFCYEWWIQEARVDGDYRRIDEDTALKLCDRYDAPLHPDFTYLWHDIDVSEAKYLRDFISKNGKIEGKYGKSSLVLKFDPKAKQILEKLLVEHKVRDGIVIEKWKVLIRCLGLDSKLNVLKDCDAKDALEFVRKVSGLDVRAKAPTRIGARMGRPEKAKERKMSPPPHMLFPLAEAGGKTRDLKNAINYTPKLNSSRGETNVDLAVRVCKNCGKESFYLKCDCGGFTEQVFICPKCGIRTKEICERCGSEARGYRKWKVNVRELYQKALENLNERDLNGTIKGVLGLTSKNKVAERIEKGILRAKNGVCVFKDGTVRYDMTDLPLTHFKPSEIGVSVEKLRELGYEVDYKGNELRNEDQIVELKPQDIILPKKAGEYLLKVAKFVDDLLVKFYKLEPFYKAEKMEDLIGHLVIGLAPHTSAGVLGRIIGFADINGCYAHPYFHAAKSRNCFSSNTKILIESNGEQKWVSVKELYEMFENERFEKGVWVKDKAKAKVFSFDFSSNKLVLTDIVDVIKAKAPEHLIRIKLKGNKFFDVTPDHSIIIYRDDGYVKVKALEVKKGDLIPCLDDGCKLFEVEEIDYVRKSDSFVYCLNAKDYHNVVINDGIITSQCDGDEDCVMLLMDGLLNFSRDFLPDKRGGQMDAPLVLTVIIDPKEVDSEVHNMDICEKYPLDFYKATLRYSNPKEFVGVIERVEDRLESDSKNFGLKFTHNTSDISLGVKESAYKTLGSMENKLRKQMELARKIVAVDEHDVAERVINFHFLPDIIGNLRAFSRQEFRCVNCNQKFRRIPLSGKCTRCGGNLTLTVHEGSIMKYLRFSKELAEEYDVSEYTRQRIKLIEYETSSLFESELKKQIKIDQFFT